MSLLRKCGLSRVLLFLFCFFRKLKQQLFSLLNKAKQKTEKQTNKQTQHSTEPQAEMFLGPRASQVQELKAEAAAHGAKEVPAEGLLARHSALRVFFGAFCQGLLGLDNFLQTNGFSVLNPLKVKLLAGEQNATKFCFADFCEAAGLHLKGIQFAHPFETCCFFNTKTKLETTIYKLQ